MIKRDKYITTSHFTDLVKQDARSFYSIDSLGIHEKEKNSKFSKKIDCIFETSKSKELEEPRMTGIEKRSGDIAGANMPSLSVLPIINVTPFSGKDQDAGRRIAVLESKVIQAEFNSVEDVPGWMWVKAVWMNATTDTAL
ncbi:hypothetical protein Golomagni_03538 [Golovinomyces magnicellulatus]|nr:hypothetical protein Golomagni_03538 [Golovinomyces magnicellulatus]